MIAVGRTNPTYRDLVRATERDWADFRRALRRPDRPHFDRLFEHARGHADAAGYCNPATPEVPILLSIVLEHEKALDDHGAALDEHRTAIADQERRLSALEERAEAIASDGADGEETGSGGTGPGEAGEGGAGEGESGPGGGEDGSPDACDGGIGPGGASAGPETDRERPDPG